jgi:hypothetical protein
MEVNEVVEKKQRSGFVRKVRQSLNTEPMTIHQFCEKLPEFTPWQINSALAYLTKKNEVSRSVVPRETKSGKKEVYAYTKVIQSESV